MPHVRAEEARAVMVELFPEGFEEMERPGGVELAAYTNAQGEERLWHVFGGAQSTDVPDGWEDRWRTFHKPVRVGKLWVGPPWETPDARLLPVIVDPGRAFGTGAHPTTQLCLQLLQETDRGSLLDVGCGSGVISIAAALLGHAPVIAVDVEVAAIEATNENAARNGVMLDARLVEPDDSLPSADVAVANISVDAVRVLPGRIEAGALITSGYLVDQESGLAGFTHRKRVEQGSWAADLYVRA
ncbi:MAG TPA: 50S ribosomal protein L11 methyltransferase [Gaiellaceae bacterium]|nr:50S ribosomal protein L11 methyltransferase [Gaiellaceae bacterium]